MDDVFLLKGAIAKLVSWVEKNNYASYDNYDFSSSKLGLWSKRLYHSHRILGFPFVGALYLADVYAPSLRKLFAHEEISAEAMPNFAIGYFRLYEIEHDIVYLHKALKCLEWLRKNHTKTRSGVGWGLQFDWQSLTFLPRGTPCITLTSYGTEAFLRGYALTGERTFLEMAIKTGEFAFNDLNQFEFGENKVAVSYTPLCHSLVINANSYCAEILCKIWDISGDDRYITLADKIVNYIISEQQSDGSWFYFDRGQGEHNFIDNFHTCFVLESLFRIYQKTKRSDILMAIRKGYSCLKENFCNGNGSVKHFFFYPTLHGIKADIRSCAESIYCHALLSELFPEALEIAKSIARWTIRNMQSSAGYFYFRIYRTHKYKMPYMRWAQAPMFNALTYLYAKLEGHAHG